jgi:hypothetical protein
MKKGQKKTFIGRVVIKSKNPDKVPDFGIGRGVLTEQEITFRDKKGQGFDTPSFTRALIDEERQMIAAVVEVEWTEKKGKR